jgi:branched-chain amino acid transport system permease protein
MDCLGYNAWLHKYIAFLIAGGVAGIAGILRNLVSAYTERWLLVLGLIYVLVVLCAPYGIVGVLQAGMLSRLSRRTAS